MPPTTETETPPTETPSTTIEIPRLPNETPKAYAARVKYVTLGPARSIARLYGQSRGETGGPRTPLSTLEQWSARYGWVDSARQYDETVAALAVQEAATQYRKDLEDHRKRYAQAGRSLYAVAMTMVHSMARQLHDGGRVLKLEDGSTYTVPPVRMTDVNLSSVVRALLTAGDLEAHSLRLEQLIPQLIDADAS